MKNLALAMLFGVGAALMLSACDPHHHHVDVDDEEYFVIPPGGNDLGFFDEFDHAYDEQAITTSDDTDGFEFSLARTTVVLITMTGTGSLDGFLDLYDDNFGFLGGDDNGGPGVDPVIVAQLSAGNYFFVAGSSNGSLGDYAVDISVEPIGGADLGVMGIPDSVIDNGGDMADAFDVDSYIFTVNSACDCDIFLTRTSGNYDGNLELLDEYGNVLAFIDPIGDTDPDILFQPLGPGTYIIRVGVGVGGGSGDYTLQVDTY